ncbi:MAG: hypothetical protein K0U59_06555 [Gammaproteobacteria bacterium]|nr:hypothetical protein [Gammaproteobacteria bacterium]
MNDNTTGLDTAIAGFESTSVNFGARLIPDAKVRIEYNLKSNAFSKEIIENVKLGKITVSQGAAQAVEMRNFLMDAMRGKTSEIARAYAVNLKTQGKSLPELEEQYSKRKFNKPFNQIPANQKGAVWREIVFSSGRPNTKANKLAKNMGRAGRLFIGSAIAISIYNISTSEDKLRGTAKEGAVIGGGLLGSVAGAAGAGLLCGPGAPICVGIGVFVGGAMSAVGTEIAFDSFWN